MLIIEEVIFMGVFLLFYKRMEGRKDPKAIFQMACFTIMWFLLYFYLIF